MFSVLILSPDPSPIQIIEEVASSLRIRTRAISSEEAAKEFLDTAPFDVFLIDHHTEEYDFLELAEYGWERSPLMVTGVFNIHGRVADAGSARLRGVEAFHGASALQSIRELLEILPSRRPIAQGARVLVVDDLDSPRTIIANYIQGISRRPVETAESVSEALTLLKKAPEKYLCVITDLNMPSEGGVQLIEKVRAEKRLSHLPVIVLTAHGTVDNLRACVVAGASGVLIKPPKKRSLAAELHKAERMLFNQQDPRLCYPNEFDELEDALVSRLGIGI